MEGKEKILEDFEAMDQFRKLNWVIMETREDEVLEEASTSSTIDSSSMNSIESSASELLEDASSSSLTSNSSSSLSLSPSDDGPLYELSELMANLPIKRGLSKFYNGKSQSFTSLASVKSLEDLAKRMNHNNNYNSQRKKIKCCKSYGGSLESQKSSNYYSPKPLIAKKVSRPSSLLSSVCTKRSNRLFDAHC
ncbi:uncharacterized protein LOC101219805 [Cucumis sativus]|uniref:Oxidative stress 3 n=1 Tax=Cucumis sativus TaxID=3659 RepID=A0A0A0LKQ7_CUCSA|nr:uncharacterized protein LOC101219805 [Cucumis sativus]KGN60571.1 hypothetical protein Csa_019427 [Cucumis sativus]